MTVDPHQSMSALAKATRIRIEGCEARREIRQLSNGDAADLVARWLREGEPRIESMPLQRLLLTIPKVGEHRLTRLLIRTGVRGDIRIGRLTPRQRGVVADACDDLRLVPRSYGVQGRRLDPAPLGRWAERTFASAGDAERVTGVHWKVWHRAISGGSGWVYEATVRRAVEAVGADITDIYDLEDAA